MDLREAFISAKEGNFVTSSMFDRNQSMHWYNGKYYYEDGAVVPEEFLYKEDWAIGYPWEIIIPKEKVDFAKLKSMHEKVWDICYKKVVTWNVRFRHEILVSSRKEIIL